jgi:hypothetical protein
LSDLGDVLKSTSCRLLSMLVRVAEYDDVVPSCVSLVIDRKCLGRGNDSRRFQEPS